MNCTAIRDLLPLHLYGDLTSDERGPVATHLETCAKCRAELAALRSVRAALDAPATVPPVDVGAVYRAEAKSLRRRTRRWQALTALALTAAVCVVALRLEVRAVGSQLVVRWGVSPAPSVAPAPDVALHPEPAAATELDERLRTVSELIRALAASVEASDHERQQEVAKLRQELAALTKLQKRLGQTERDVSALYTAQFGSRPTGVNP